MAGGGAEVVGGAKEDLQAAPAGGDADAVVEFEALIDEGGEGPAGGEDGDTAADVAGEGLDLLKGGELAVLFAGGDG